MASDAPRYMVVAIGLLMALLFVELVSMRGSCPPTNHVQGSLRRNDLGAAAAGRAEPSIRSGPHIRSNWALQLTKEHERKVYSQCGQDGILEYIFHHVGTTNKYFVEFGFDATSFELSQGANTAILYRRYGWRGLLMDGNNANATINLHPERIYPHNILSLFHKYKVPAEPDYVSIDIDSTDLWVFKKIITSGIWRPRVITTEYNCNFPYNSTVAWPPTHNGTWNGTRFFGSAMGAFDAVAREAGYSIVWVIAPVDIFYVRNDILAGTTDVFPLSHFEKCGRVPFHRPATQEEVDKYIEYHTYQRTGSVEQAAAAAQRQMKEMGVDLTN